MSSLITGAGALLQPLDKAMFQYYFDFTNMYYEYYKTYENYLLKYFIMEVKICSFIFIKPHSFPYSDGC